MDEEITITLFDDRGGVSPERLIEALENTISILRGLEPDLAIRSDSIRWKIVNASMQSPLRVSLRPILRRRRDEGKARKVIKRFYDGVKEISVHPVRPKHFDDEALEATSRLASYSPDVERITIDVTGESPLTPPETIKANVKEVIEKTKTYYDVGSIEGQLDNIITHDGYSVQVWESLTNYRVDCIVEPAVLEQAKSWLRKRVQVTGKIRYRNVKPVSIKVDRMIALRDRSQLPQLEDIGPIQLTGEMLPEEIIRDDSDDD